MDAMTLGMAILFGGLTGAAAETEGTPLPARQARAVIGRMMVTELFLGSAEEAESRSVGRYFSRREYARLRGNPVLGYWDVGAFRWVGGERLAWDGIRNAHPSARSITSRAWGSAMRLVADKQGIHLSPDASVRLEGACVAAVVDATNQEPVPGVLLELRVKSPTGILLYRVAVGKATVEDAMGAALELVLSFSRSQETAERGVSREPAR
jgi:hypothetical protein